eukprot:gene4543-4871_t
MTFSRLQCCLLLLLIIFPTLQSFYNPLGTIKCRNLPLQTPRCFAVRESQKVVNPLVDEDLRIVYQYWDEFNDHLPQSSPNYLSRTTLRQKFLDLIKIFGDSSSVLSVLQTDVNILSYKTELIANSFSAWRQHH